MPLYEYKCCCKKSYEKLFSYKDRPKFIDCIGCGCNAHLVSSVASMQPDKFWNGVQVNGKNFTSKTQFNNYLKNNDYVVKEPGIGKKRSDVVKDRINKSDSAIESAIVKSYEQAGIN